MSSTISPEYTPHLRPIDRFISFFGCDGVGKSTLVTAMASVLGESAVIVRGSKPKTWPGGPTAHDFVAMESAVRAEQDQQRRELRRLAFSRTIIAANYARAAMIAQERTVLNDSDVMIKALVWTALRRENLRNRFNDFASTLEREADGAFPSAILYVQAPGSTKEQIDCIASRLQERSDYSASDPRNDDEIAKRLAANRTVYDFLSEETGITGLTIRAYDNPPLPPVNPTAHLLTNARNALDVLAIGM